MKIIVAPDSFKGSLSTLAACEAVERGVRRIFPEAEIIKIPVADGGEGTIDAFAAAVPCQVIRADAADPLGRRITARFAILDEDGTAVIEMAEASGLTLLRDSERDPLKTTSCGTGELVRAALDRGCRRIIIGLGGSATNDGGIGLAQALGVSFKDASGHELGFGGGELGKLAAIDCSAMDDRLSGCEIIAACDVKNPLFGETGASRVFGPQKGASPGVAAELDENLRHYAAVILDQLQADVQAMPGTGAAGGIPAALTAFFGAKIRPGIDLILDVVHFDRHLETADLVMTGEGRIDSQTAFGKVIAGIAGRAKAYKVPVVALTGSAADGHEAVFDVGIGSVVSIVNRPMPLGEAMENAGKLLEDAAAGAMRLIRIGMEIKS